MTAPARRKRWNVKTHGPGGYAGGCNCDVCIEGHRAYHSAYGRVRRQVLSAQRPPEKRLVSAKKAAEHAQNLVDAGMPAMTIARAAGLHVGTVHRLLSGSTEQIVQWRAAAILAVTPAPPRVDSTGTVRRVHALVAIGWRTKDLAPAMGLSPLTIDTFRTHPNPTVYRATAEAVAKAYRTLALKEGPSLAARASARRHGWPGPLAWDADTIDDPTAVPELDTQDTPQRGVDLDEFLFLMDAGEEPRRAAERFGVTLSAVENAARRHDRGDVLDHIATRARRAA